MPGGPKRRTSVEVGDLADILASGEAHGASATGEAAGDGNVLEGALPASWCAAAGRSTTEELVDAVDAACSSTTTASAVLRRIALALNSAYWPPQLGRSARLGALHALCCLARLRRFRDSVFEALSVIDEGFERSLAMREMESRRGKGLGRYHELMLVTLCRVRDYDLAAGHLLEYLGGDTALAVRVLAGAIGRGRARPAGTAGERDDDLAAAEPYEDEVLRVCCNMLASLTDPQTYFAESSASRGADGDREFELSDPAVMTPFLDGVEETLYAAHATALFDVAADALKHRLFALRSDERHGGGKSEEGAGGGAGAESKGGDDSVSGDSELDLPERWGADATREAKRAGLYFLRTIRNLYVYAGQSTPVLFNMLENTRVIPSFVLPFVSACAIELGGLPAGPRAALLREGVCQGLKVLSLASFRHDTLAEQLRGRNPTQRLLQCKLVTAEARALGLVAVFNVAIDAFAKSGWAGKALLGQWHREVAALDERRLKVLRSVLAGRGWLPIAKSNASYELVCDAVAPKALNVPVPSPTDKLACAVASDSTQSGEAEEKVDRDGGAAPTAATAALPVAKPPAVKKEWYGQAVPDRFLCALSGAVMREPVYSSSAATAAGGTEKAPRYARSAAEAAAEAGKPCPVTHVRLRHGELCSDDALAREITLWHVTIAVSGNTGVLDDGADDSLYDF